MFEYRGWNKKKQVMVYNREDNEADWWDGMKCTDVEMVNGRLNSDYSDYIFMLWTGKYDKNGKKIYQGDITIDGSLYEQVCFGEYQLDVGGLAIGFYTKSRFDETIFFSNTSGNIEVVGNIYENTDLLLK